MTEMQSGTTLADELLQRIGQTVGDKANVSTVFGDPVERAGITVIPVIPVSPFVVVTTLAVAAAPWALVVGLRD